MSNSQQSISELPELAPADLELSDALVELIKQEINISGPLPFSRFVQRALYEPGYGYYMNGLAKFGAAGDFVTAPELSPLFSRCLAMQCAQLLDDIPKSSILELGAGSGVMAADCLLQLQTMGELPEKYYILELSASLRQRQQQAIEKLPLSLSSRVQWLDSLEGLAFTGIILANEVLDALPVDRFVIHLGEVMAMVVGWSEDKHLLTCQPVPASLELTQAVRQIETAVGQPFAEGYCSEINFHTRGWLKGITEPLLQGVVLAIDYGYPRAEYYHEQRNMGTLICHYRHRAHDDVLRWVGLQDITAQVDFTAVAEAASACELEVLGYTHQATFLIDSGIEQFMAEMGDATTVEQVSRAQQAKILLLPTEMGERFKVMALSKQYNKPLKGFGQANDLRHYL